MPGLAGGIYRQSSLRHQSRFITVPRVYFVLGRFGYDCQIHLRGFSPVQSFQEVRHRLPLFLGPATSQRADDNENQYHSIGAQ